MKKILLGIAVTIFSSVSVMAQVSNVSPQPQEVTTGKVFDLPAHYARSSKDSGPRMIEGIVGRHKGVKKYRKLVPQHPEGYYLNIDPEGNVVIAARDEQGLFYGRQTFLKIKENGKLQECTIRDWPDVAWRGVVEGFYGQPWSHNDRMRQLFFYGQNKMNVYIYGPKDDPYHRDHWREEYPADKAIQIRDLVNCAKANHVKFYWAIHPGVDIKWNDADRDHLITKLGKMYDLGVRSFAVFFDDIWGEGANGDKQAALLNYIDEQFVKQKGDVSPLLLCPTEYNRSWSKDDSPYLHALGTKLNKGIEVMWTGNSVVHCIDRESMEWINQRIQRKAYIWWNFPVNDFVRDHILLGPAYGNGMDIAGHLSGFVSNPMQYAESSKLALFNVAEYTWNMKQYNYEESWTKALKALMPSCHEALRIFATYNEDLGKNGHGFRRDESRQLKPVAESAVKGDAPSVEKLKTACKELKTASQTLFKSTENIALIDELNPWLLQAINVADYGTLICDMALDATTVADHYERVKAISRKMYDLENDKSLMHPYQTGAKVGTLVLVPALNALFHNAVEAYNAANNTKLDTNAEYQPLHLTSTVPQLAMLPVTMRGKNITVTPSNEVITWQPDGRIDITCDEVIILGGLDFNFGEPDQARNFRLECQNAKGKWSTISLCHYKEGETVVHTGAEIGGMECKALRLTNISGKELKLYFKSFRFDRR